MTAERPPTLVLPGGPGSNEAHLPPPPKELIVTAARACTRPPQLRAPLKSNTDSLTGPCALPITTSCPSSTCALHPFCPSPQPNHARTATPTTPMYSTMHKLKRFLLVFTLIWARSHATPKGVRACLLRVGGGVWGGRGGGTVTLDGPCMLYTAVASCGLPIGDRLRVDSAPALARACLPCLHRFSRALSCRPKSGQGHRGR